MAKRRVRLGVAAAQGVGRQFGRRGQVANATGFALGFGRGFATAGGMASVATGRASALVAVAGKSASSNYLLSENGDILNTEVPQRLLAA